MTIWPVASGVAWRTTRNVLKTPSLLLPTALFPLFFFTAFAGGLSQVENVPGFDYPGDYTSFQFVFVLLQSAAFGGVFTGFGIARDFVELVGRLDTYVTRTGFEVTPLVGLVRPDFTLAPDTFEVAEVFEVPLGFLIDPANHRRESRVFGGSTRYFYAMPWNRYYIWGATAGMLVNLSEVLWPHVPGQQPPVGQTARP